jgi:hypothetical protein
VLGWLNVCRGRWLGEIGSKGAEMMVLSGLLVGALGCVASPVVDWRGRGLQNKGVEL